VEKIKTKYLDQIQDWKNKYDNVRSELKLLKLAHDELISKVDVEGHLDNLQ